MLLGPWVCPPAHDSNSGTANTWFHHEPRRVLGPLRMNSWSPPAALGVGLLSSPTEAEAIGDIRCIRTPTIMPQRAHTRTFCFIRSGKGPGRPHGRDQKPILRATLRGSKGSMEETPTSPGPFFSPHRCSKSYPHRVTPQERSVSMERILRGVYGRESHPS